jgi:hypothetical protein
MSEVMNAQVEGDDIPEEKTTIAAPQLVRDADTLLSKGLRYDQLREKASQA